MSGAPGSLRRWLAVAAGAGFLALVAAFVPSPFGVAGWFEKPTVVTVPRLPKLVLREMPPISEFAEIAARPLFNSGRVPDPQGNTSAVGAPGGTGAPGELADFRLVGIVTNSTTQLAIVERAGARSMKVVPGDQLSGWRVDRIDASGLVVTKDARSLRIGIPKARPPVGTP